MVHWKKTAAWGLVAAVLGLAGLAAALFLVDVNRFKPVIQESVRKATGREMTMAGELRLSPGLRPVITAGDVRITNAEWGSRPELASIRRVEVQVSLLPLLQRRIEILRLALIEPDILLEIDPTGAPNLTLPPAGRPPRTPPGAPSEEAPASPRILTLRHLDIQNGRIAFRDARTGAAHAAAAETLTAVRETGSDRTRVSMKGAVNRIPVDFSGQFLQPEPGLFRLEEIRLDARPGEGAFTATGRIDDLLARKAALKVHLSAPSLPRLAALAGIRGLPEVGPVTASADLEIPDPATFRATSLTLAFQESDLEGSAALSLSGTRPKLEASLSSRRLDLRLPVLRPSVGTGGPAASGGRVFPATPLPLGGLHHMDANVRLRLAQLLTHQAAVSNLDARIRLDAGRLRMTPLRGASDGSTWTATLDINTAERIPPVALTFRGSRLNLEKLFSLPGPGKALSGRSDIDANLNSRGRSVAEMMGNLNGRVVFALQNGRVERRLLDQFPLYAIRGLTEQLFSLMDIPAGGRVEIRCLFADLDIRNGTADVSPLVINTPGMTIFGTGDVYLKTERLDLSVSTEPTRATNVIQLGMSQLTRIFKVTGTLARPRLSVDPARTAMLFAKALGGTTIAGALIAAESLLGSRDAGENPCLRMAAPAERQDPASKAIRKTDEVMKRAVEDAKKSILNLFNNP